MGLMIFSHFKQHIPTCLLVRVQQNRINSALRQDKARHSRKAGYWQSSPHCVLIASSLVSTRLLTSQSCYTIKHAFAHP